MVLQVCATTLNSRGRALHAGLTLAEAVFLVTEMAKARSGSGAYHAASPDASQLRSGSRSPFGPSNSHAFEALSGPLLHYPSQAMLTSQSAYCMPTLTTVTETKQLW